MGGMTLPTFNRHNLIAFLCPVMFFVLFLPQQQNGHRPRGPQPLVHGRQRADHLCVPRDPSPKLRVLAGQQRHHADQAQQTRYPQPVRPGCGPAHQLCPGWDHVHRVRVGGHHGLWWVYTARFWTFEIEQSSFEHHSRLHPLFCKH